VGSGPVMMDAGDLNGDGKTDLAVANSGSNNVSVLFNNGSGVFGAAVNYTVGTGPQAVTIGDVTGDRKRDLVVSNYNSNTLSILTNNGSGGFGTATPFTTGTGPGTVAIGDINGDAKADLAVANYTSHNISVFLNSCTAGTYIPLPVQLTSFKAVERSGSVQLAWTVAEERGIDRYEVEKSLRGDNFQKIGEVGAANTSVYNFFDNAPAQGKNFFRLRIIENDGSYRYSSIVAVIIGSDIASIAIYPNPTSNHRLGLQLVNQPQGLYRLKLYNNVGQQVMSKLINHTIGSSFETIVLPPGIDKGLYHAVVESTNGRKGFDLIIE